MAVMKDLWDRLEAWHAKQGSSLQLRPPATAEQIAAAEEAMGLVFPDDFRASLLVHDGQESDASVTPWCPATCPLASLERMVAQHQEVQGLVEPVEGDPPLDLEDHFINILYYSNRIPIAGTPWFDASNRLRRSGRPRSSAPIRPAP